MNNQQNPNATRSIDEMDAGIFTQKITAALAEVALGAIQHRKKGKVIIELNLEPIGTSSQLNITHKIASTKPTLNGKVTEDETTSTPMYTNTLGFLSVSPDAQIDIFNTKPEVA